jgi:site-specific DNA-adenine methylase
MLPPHSTYVEPFAGGAAVFFHKPLVKVNVLGDHDKWLVDFYGSARKGGLRKCWGGFRKSKDLFQRSKKNRSACHKIALAALSFHADRATYTGEGNAKTGAIMHKAKLKRYLDYEDKLKRSWLAQGDFERTMRKFDSRETVHFLDPPWPIEYSDVLYKGGNKARVSKNQAKLKSYKDTAFDPAHVKKVSKSMKGHVFIIINDTKALRGMYCKDPAFKCRGMKVMTNIGNRNVYKSNLLITKKARRA